MFASACKEFRYGFIKNIAARNRPVICEGRRVMRFGNKTQASIIYLPKKVVITEKNRKWHLQCLFPLYARFFDKNKH